jgi:hypothetical protein
VLFAGERLKVSLHAAELPSLAAQQNFVIKTLLCAISLCDFRLHKSFMRGRLLLIGFTDTHTQHSLELQHTQRSALTNRKCSVKSVMNNNTPRRRIIMPFYVVNLTQFLHHKNPHKIQNPQPLCVWMRARVFIGLLIFNVYRTACNVCVCVFE